MGGARHFKKVKSSDGLRQGRNVSPTPQKTNATPRPSTSQQSSSFANNTEAPCKAFWRYVAKTPLPLRNLMPNASASAIGLGRERHACTSLGIPSGEKSAVNSSGDKTPFVAVVNATKRVVSENNPDATFDVMNGRKDCIKKEGEHCKAFCADLTPEEVQEAEAELRTVSALKKKLRWASA
jgi:hypothetical protein